MCGFVLSIDDADFNLLKSCKAIAHRGPTSTKYFVDSRIKCGFNRLSIIDDDPQSDQPIVDCDGRWLLVFNGEIYNYKDLRLQLSLHYGYQFSTQSDSEVLLVGLGYEGRHFIEKLNGIYAFVFVDLRDYSILAARDPFGVKPLFFARHRQSLYFCSESKPLAGVIGANLDRQSTALMLSSGSTLMGDSIFTGVHSMKPNTVIDVSHQSINEYRIIKKNILDNVLDSSEEEVVNMIKVAVQRQLPSIDFGLQLSGGVDSTFLLSLVDNVPNFSTTYAVNVNDPEMSEKFWQDMALDYFGKGKTHRLIELGIDDFKVDNLRTVAFNSDVPFFHPSFVGATMMAQRAAEDGLKVLISGEGADEIFLGYRWFFNNESINSIFEYSPIGEISQYLGVSPPSLKFLQDMDRLEFFQEWYLQRWLGRSDLTGMRHSIEIRVPFLDLELVNAINQISRDYKQRHGAKWILKNELLRSLPPEFVHRRKRGFDFPLNSWMTDEHINFLKSNKDLFEISNEEMKFLANSVDYKSKRLIFALCCFAIWMGR